MALNWPAKDPDEVLDYSWTPALSQGDHIVSATATRVSGSVTLDATAHSDTAVTLTLSGGADGETSVFQIRVTTHGDYVLEETLYITCTASANADVAAFKRRYPSFATVDNETVATYLADATADVGDWGDLTDRATYLLAAHMMTLNGIGSGTEAEMANNGATGMTRLKSGAFEVAFSGAVNTKSAYMVTRFGSQFYELLRRVKAGPIVTDSGVV